MFNACRKKNSSGAAKNLVIAAMGLVTHEVRVAVNKVLKGFDGVGRGIPCYNCVVAPPAFSIKDVCIADEEIVFIIAAPNYLALGHAEPFN